MASKKTLLVSVLVVGIGVAALIVGGTAIGNQIENKEIESTFAIENPYDIAPRLLSEDTIKELQEGKERANILTPEEVENRIQNKESFYLHIFKPSCEDCPEELKILNAHDIFSIPYASLNGIEYEEFLESHNIEQLPAVISYIDGQELTRVAGTVPSEDLDRYFEDSQNILIPWLDSQSEEQVVSEDEEGSAEQQ